MNLKTIRPWLQLVRLPNVITAGADSLAGWLLATGSPAEVGRWLPLVATSMILYASGTALNDVLDYEIDRAERPRRPLPSGQISRRAAAILAISGLAIGPLLAFSMGTNRTGLVALALALAIVCYDAGLKHTPLGPLFMGACRGLNLFLGMAAASSGPGLIGCWTAISYAVFVSGITLMSRTETTGDDRRALTGGLTLQNLALAGLAGIALSYRHFPNASAERPLIPLEGLLILAIVALAVNIAALAALTKPDAPSIQKSIKTSLLALTWLHVGVIAAVRGWEPAALVALFWPPAFVLGRWLYTT